MRIKLIEHREVDTRQRLEILVKIPATEFQKFDRGGEISVDLAVNLDLRAYQRISWEADQQLHGICEVTGVNGTRHHIRKLR